MTAALVIRIDGAGTTHDVVEYLVAHGLSYSVGFTLPTNTAELLALIPDRAWTPAYDSDGKVRDGAWVAELTGLVVTQQRNQVGAGWRRCVETGRPPLTRAGRWPPCLFASARLLGIFFTAQIRTSNAVP
jgi:hypothetical protein